MSMSKNQLKGAYESYKWHVAKYGYRTIHEAYKNPSYKKINAWEYCRDLCREFNGTGLAVVGSNCFTFSAGFTFKDDEGKNCYCHITPSNNYIVEVDDE